MINQTNSFLDKSKIANKSNNCDMPTQIAELIKYLNELLTITVMTLPSAFFSFEKTFDAYPAFFNIVNQHTLRVSAFFCSS